MFVCRGGGSRQIGNLRKVACIYIIIPAVEVKDAPPLWINLIEIADS
jgi:hypothetical protein